MQLTVGLVCVAIGAALILFAALWNPGSPPVEVVLSQSGAQVFKGVYVDAITIQNRSGQNVTVVVLVKTVLDGFPRESAPVTVCGQCRTIVRIEEIQPTPDMNLDYYQGAINSPEYIHIGYGPTLLSSFARSALPAGLSAVAVGLIVLIYRRTGKRQD
ncbi:MAG: hypothetical protein ABSC50_00150 [Candidatus Bathyarchaeia archaeon]